MMKVALYLATGFEEIEALTTVDILRRAEIEVDLVALGGNLQVAGAHNIKVIADTLIEEISHKGYDMIYRSYLCCPPCDWKDGIFRRQTGDLLSRCGIPSIWSCL